MFSRAGRIGDRVNAGSVNGTSTNVEVNLLDGSVLFFDFFVNPGSTLNFSEGHFGQDSASPSFNARGSTVNFLGESAIGVGIFASDGAVINASSGTVSGTLSLGENGRLNVNGATVGSRNFSDSIPIIFNQGGVVDVSSGQVNGGIEKSV